MQSYFWGKYTGILQFTCEYHKMGFISEERAKRVFKYHYSKIDEKIKEKKLKNEINWRLKTQNCEKLMP